MPEALERDEPEARGASRPRAAKTATPAAGGLSAISQSIGDLPVALLTRPARSSSGVIAPLLSVSSAEKSVATSCGLQFR